MKIHPVIHHLDRATSLEQVALARDLGADGVFLISHRGEDRAVVDVAAEAKIRYPDFAIGINLLSESPVQACFRAAETELDMVWADDMGISSAGATDVAKTIAEFAQAFPAKNLFASVAFKYRARDPIPVRAARLAREHGFIPTTSGSATGVPPPLDKIASMSLATSGHLAVASGMTPENIGTFAPYLSHVLVATGISLDEYRIDSERLTRFVTNARRAQAASRLQEVAGV